jgi:hypothetical protein
MPARDINIADKIGAYPICDRCKSKQVVRDAWATWNMLTGEWLLKAIFDAFACDACGEECNPVWALDEAFRTKRIQRLNDAMRRGEFEHGSVVITQGLLALDQDALEKISISVAMFDAFTGDNDPHAEHDFGSVSFNGDKLFWKIDYFDLALKYHSPDAANPSLTHRVLTIMLAHEY